MNSHSELKKKYEAMWDCVKMVIDEWDPLHLLKMGCPPDEYNPEIGDIVVVLPKVNDAEELAVSIQEIFLKWFGRSEDYLQCLKVAHKILFKFSNIETDD